MFSPLSDLTWRRVSLELKNTRNVHGKEHPLAIFEAIFKEAKNLPGREVDLDLIFHPAGYRLPDRINKNRTYSLEIIFFQATLDTIEHFLENLRIHLDDWRNNFALVSVSAVTKRCLLDVEKDHDPLPEGCSEICLEFLTPFPFTPKIKDKGARGRRELIDRNYFFSILYDRVARAFSLKKEWPHDLDDFRLLPYYWKYRESRHRPKSNQGDSELINGGMGPLYIKGPIKKIYPLLLLCSEINASRSPAKGRGYYVIRRKRQFFDLKLRKTALLRKAYDFLKWDSDLDTDLSCAITGPDEMLRELHNQIVDGSYSPAPFSGFTLAKKSGGSRLIASAEPRDHLVEKMLHELLTETFERMFEECSIGFRRGRSRQEAKKVIASAVRQGYSHVFESDIESFFDMIDWHILLERLAGILPETDTLTFSLLEKFIKADLTVNGREQMRSQGLIQGMVLAPLLANLYLDSFDEEMTALGYWMLRYGDDFLVMARSRKEGEQAKKHATAILEYLKLNLKSEKTAITTLDAGFSFLGFDFGPELDEEFIDRTALRKTVFIRNLYSFIGIDSDSVIIRKDKSLISRLPINRIGEIVVFGNNTVSTRLLHRCSKENISVSFCQAGGRYINTLRPDSMAYFAIAAQHSNRFYYMSDEQRLIVAQKIAIAKIFGYISWFSSRYGTRAREICHLLQQRSKAMQKTDRVESIRGHEGEASGRIFTFLRSLTVNDFFLTGKQQRPTQWKRQPRVKCDPFNVLLDFASFLIFSRLNVLLRSQGLNPYLGFLHSHKDHYESLVCDLQEPFRARMNRFILRTINRKIIRPEHFEFSKQYKTYSITQEGVRLFLEAFERELRVRLTGDGGTLLQLLVAQVQVIRQWVTDEGKKLFFYMQKENS
jgi:group II intron reverse transcriptase/maturase/CRISPR-associated endonuclease Cas1